jgi:hypothetical protein
MAKTTWSRVREIQEQNPDALGNEASAQAGTEEALKWLLDDGKKETDFPHPMVNEPGLVESGIQADDLIPGAGSAAKAAKASAALVKAGIRPEIAAALLAALAKRGKTLATPEKFKHVTPGPPRKVGRVKPWDFQTMGTTVSPEFSHDGLTGALEELHGERISYSMPEMQTAARLINDGVENDPMLSAMEKELRVTKKSRLAEYDRSKRGKDKTDIEQAAAAIHGQYPNGFDKPPVHFNINPDDLPMPSDIQVGDLMANLSKMGMDVPPTSVTGKSLPPKDLEASKQRLRGHILRNKGKTPEGLWGTKRKMHDEDQTIGAIKAELRADKAKAERARVGQPIGQLIPTDVEKVWAEVVRDGLEGGWTAYAAQKLPNVPPPTQEQVLRKAKKLAWEHKRDRLARDKPFEFSDEDLE